MSHTNQPESSTSPASTKRPAKRSLRWRVLRFCLLGAATLITLFALWHVEENVRGKRAWNNYKTRLEANGVVFEVEALAPRPVPDDQNFAMTPLLKPLLDVYPPETFDAEGKLLQWRDPAGKARAEAITLNDPDLDTTETVSVPNRVDWRLGEQTSLEGWQRYYAASTNFPSWPLPRTPAEDVLKALSRYDAELDELRTAADRPYSRFNLRYNEENPWTILLSHLGPLRNISKVIQLKAIAELKSGDVAAAFEDVQLMFALADSIKDEPFLISHLVRIVLLKMAEQTVWQGMANHQWTPGHLEQFQHRFESINLLKELKRSIEAERAFGAELTELIARRPGFLLDIQSSTGSQDFGGQAMNLLPRGWWYLEGVNHSRVFDEYLLPVLPDDPAGLDVRLIESKYGEIEALIAERNPVIMFLKHRFFIRMLLPALGNAAKRSVEAQAFAGLAATAIALDRYYLANHSYPTQLSTLAPDFIAHTPEDPVTHEALLYERTADDVYRLWSVGWNGKDDGGVVLYETRGGKRKRRVRDQPDWVWPSAGGIELREKAE